MISLRAALGVPVALVTVAVLLVISRSREMRIAAAIVSLTLATGALSATGVVFRLRVRNDLAMAVVTFNSIAWGLAVIAITSAGGAMVPLAVAFTVSSAASAALIAILARRRAAGCGARGRIGRCLRASAPRWESPGC